MRIKRYSFLSLLLIAIIGLYVYAFVGTSFTLSFFGTPVTLPAAVWIVLILSFFFLASVAHMVYYSFKGYLEERRYVRDLDRVIDALCNALFKEPKRHDYKTDSMKLIGSLLDRATLELVEPGFKTANKKLDEAIETVEKISAGGYVELRRQLSLENEILLKNLENKMAQEPRFSESILKKSKEYAPLICYRAYEILSSYGDLAQIKRYQQFMSKEALFTLCKRVGGSKNPISLNAQEIMRFLALVKPDVSDFLMLAKILKVSMEPDERLRLFEQLDGQNEEAKAAYLYTLFDLELIDRGREILENTGEKEYLKFKAYLDLKDCGKNYKLDLFL